MSCGNTCDEFELDMLPFIHHSRLTIDYNVFICRKNKEYTCAAAATTAGQYLLS